MPPSTEDNGELADQSAITPSDDGADDELTKDEIFHLLQNERRRRVLLYLRAHDEGAGVDMRDVAEWVAAEENDITVQELRSKERQRVYIALYQSHLPKLDDAGVIEYDQRAGWIEATDRTPAVERYLLEVVDETPTVTDEAGTGSFRSAPTVAAVAAGAVLIALGQLGVVESLSGWGLAVALFGVLVVTVLWTHRTDTRRFLAQRS